MSPARDFSAQAIDDLFGRYAQKVAGLMGDRSGRVTIIDVGGGKECPFVHLASEAGPTIVAVDVSGDELA